MADACYKGMYRAPTPILSQLDVNQLVNSCANDFAKEDNDVELYFHDEPLRGRHRYLRWMIMWAIQQGESSIRLELVTTAPFDAFHQVEDSEQARKQVKRDVETPVIPLISSIGSEPSASSAPDLVPAATIVRGTTQPPDDEIFKPSSAPAPDPSPAASIPPITTQPLGDGISQQSTPSALNPSPAVMVPQITRQPASSGNPAGTSPAASQQRCVSLTLRQTPEPSGVMAPPITPAGQSGSHVFATPKSTPGVSTSMTSSSVESATTSPSAMTPTMVLPAGVGAAAPTVENPNSGETSNTTTRPPKPVFRYSLPEFARFSGEPKLLNDYLGDYETGASLDEDAMDQDFRNSRDEDQGQGDVMQDANARADRNVERYVGSFPMSFRYSLFQVGEGPTE